MIEIILLVSITLIYLAFAVLTTLEAWDYIHDPDNWDKT